MRIMNWTAVEESGPIERPPVGGYVVRVVGVEEVEPKEYVSLVYDIAEGPYANFYDDPFGRANPWAHRFVRSYKESARGMFKAFLCRLEESNRGFSIEQWQRRCDARDFVGLELGVVLQYEDYTNDRGEDKERLQVVSVVSAQDVRSGNYKVPGRKDSRRKAPEAAGFGEPVPTSVYDEYLPF